MPFSLGRRVCPGFSMAEKELFIFFACCMQRFTLEFDDEGGSRARLPGIRPEDTSPCGNLRCPPMFRMIVRERS